MIRANVVISVLGVGGLLLACAKEPGQPGAEPPISRTSLTSVVQRTTTIRPAVRPPPPAPAPQQAQPTPQEPADTSGTGVVVTDEVLRACSLSSADAANAPRFDVNSSTLRPHGEDVLSKVATCVKDGKLGNRELKLVGYTDPRGSAEYNMKLGRERANAAKNYLEHLGVPERRMITDSRGEEEAKGTDEASWALDRRVEVQLAEGKSGRAAPGSTK